MATFDRELVLAVGPQSAEGTADSTIAALSGSLDLSDGIILGDAGSGLAESGITHSFTRREREPGTVAGSFTRLDGDFLEEQISLQFAFPLAGPRTTTTATPVDGDFTQEKGIDALLAACGLDGAASTSNPSVGWKYTPANVSLATIKLFDSGFAWVIRDVRGDITLQLTPGEVGIATVTLRGVIDSAGAISFPTVDFEEQATVNAPSVVSTSPSWGGISRGWLDLSISVANALEEIPDSAQSTGRTIEQTGRTITVDMTIKDDDSDLDFTRANLVEASASTDDLTATIGDAASGSDPALAYQLEVQNLRVLSYTPAVAGTKAASQVSAVATGATADSEFFLAFL